ncbi:hypothetical protein HCH_04528 [Hahella chejuensis KCTC 2396]|uniref:Uncharacterized protein n=1 Tax=Hahella chejuensis (strain KCTC 2396) TaxID=349521 RepID=Q2SDP5_HAHCH|nr:hypothetical protein HCH_04528 [Hahella chejuensis KCTC 2396]
MEGAPEGEQGRVGQGELKTGEIREIKNRAILPNSPGTVQAA